MHLIDKNKVYGVQANKIEVQQAMCSMQRAGHGGDITVV